MNDRELLEMAAKAAGIKLTSWQNVEYPKNSGIHGALYCMSHYWNPLTDDSDALRLAVKLHMFDYGGLKQFRLEETRLDPSRDDCAIMRRAIVRAAAEIGRDWPGNEGVNHGTMDGNARHCAGGHPCPCAAYCCGYG